jgi:hypothetical protein
MSINIEEILLCAHGSFDEPIRSWNLPQFTTNYCIIITNAYYNYVINVKYNFCIFNKRLLEKCDKEENLKVTGAATTPSLIENCKTFWPISRIYPFTARPATQ